MLAQPICLNNDKLIHSKMVYLEVNKMSDVKNIISRIASDKEFRQSFVENPDGAFQSAGFGSNIVLRSVFKEMVKLIWTSEFPHYMFGC